MHTRIFRFVIAFLSFAFIATSTSWAEKPKAFDFSTTSHVMTMCCKADIIWSIQYGEENGMVIYAIFHKGSHGSPVSSCHTIRSNGTRESTVHIDIPGLKVDPPNPEKNSMLIEGKEVKRGTFTPLHKDAFHKFLQEKEALDLSALEKAAQRK